MIGIICEAFVSFRNCKSFYSNSQTIVYVYFRIRGSDPHSKRDWLIYIGAIPLIVTNDIESGRIYLLFFNNDKSKVKENATRKGEIYIGR